MRRSPGRRRTTGRGARRSGRARGRRTGRPRCGSGPRLRAREVLAAARPPAGGSRAPCSVLKRQLETARSTGSRSMATTCALPEHLAALAAAPAGPRGSSCSSRRAAARSVRVREVGLAVPASRPCAEASSAQEDLGLGTRRPRHRDARGVRRAGRGGRSYRIAARRSRGGVESRGDPLGHVVGARCALTALSVRTTYSPSIDSSVMTTPLKSESSTTIVVQPGHRGRRRRSDRTR